MAEVRVQHVGPRCNHSVPPEGAPRLPARCLVSACCLDDSAVTEARSAGDLPLHRKRQALAVAMNDLSFERGDGTKQRVTDRYARTTKRRRSKEPRNSYRHEEGEDNNPRVSPHETRMPDM